MDDELKVISGCGRWLDKLPTKAARLRVLDFLRAATADADEGMPPDPRQPLLPLPVQGPDER